MGKRKRKNTALYFDEPESDKNFQFIAGYTVIQAYEIRDQWNEYQKDRLREIAIKWCQQNMLAYK